MQAMPQQSYVYVLNYKTRLGVPFSGQDWVEYTNISSNRSQTLSLNLDLKPSLSWSTDVTGYDVGVYTNYDRAVEWRVTKRPLTTNYGQTQSVEPGVRTINNSGNASFRRWYYGEFWVSVHGGTEGIIVSPDAYYYSDVTLTDR